uniref:Uncharacterized protein n=1 Tax=Meloidogyne enterolobii TaxID=390850 RepID=A0A6V7VCD6_MELEN|nr:unnamed protein product [Meloidogyne enterolobii]
MKKIFFLESRLVYRIGIRSSLDRQKSYMWIRCFFEPGSSQCPQFYLLFSVQFFFKIHSSSFL